MTETKLQTKARIFKENVTSIYTDRCDEDWQILYGLIGYQQYYSNVIGKAGYGNRIYILFGLITIFIKQTG